MPRYDKRWNPDNTKADTDPGAIDWTPHIQPGYLDIYKYNEAIFAGELLGDPAKRKKSRAIEGHPDIADLPPNPPYRATAEMFVFPKNTQIYPDRGMLQEIPQAIFGDTDFHGAGYTPYDSTITMQTYLWGDAQGNIARRLTDFKNGFMDALRSEFWRDFPAFIDDHYASNERRVKYWQKKNENIVGALPAFMDETFVDGKPRHVFVQSVDPKRSCDKFFNAKGKPHREGGRPAIIMRHASGELLEYYENGKPHCLTGPWRQGREEGKIVKDEGHREPAKAVEPEYAIHGKKLTKTEFYAHPDVIAARAQEGMFGRLSTWFANKVKGYQDDQSDLSDLRRFDGTSQMGMFLETLDPDIRRDVIGKLAGIFIDDPAAKPLQNKRLKEAVLIAARNDAAEKLMGAAGHADVIVRDISGTRDEFAKMKMDSVVDTLDAHIATVTDAKKQDEQALLRADALLNPPDGKQKEMDDAFETAHAIMIGTNLPGGKPESAQKILRELERQHDKLPDIAEETATLGRAATKITKAADAAMDRMPMVMEDVLRISSIAKGYLSNKYNMGAGAATVDLDEPLAKAAPKRKRARVDADSTL